jgi:hypothetical protein
MPQELKGSRSKRPLDDHISDCSRKAERDKQKWPIQSIDNRFSQPYMTFNVHVARRGSATQRDVGFYATRDSFARRSRFAEAKENHDEGCDARQKLRRFSKTIQLLVGESAIAQSLHGGWIKMDEQGEKEELFN